MKDLQTIINNFLDNIDQYDTQVLEAVAHLIDVELMERDYLANPQNFGGADYDN